MKFSDPLPPQPTRYASYTWFACDVIAAMLVYDNNRVVITFFVVYTNMVAIPFVIWIPGIWVQTNNSYFCNIIESIFKSNFWMW